jgi:hypothetical protein
MIPFFNVFYIKVLYHVAYVYLIIKVFSACERIEEANFFSWSTRRFFVTYVSSRVFWVLGARQIFFLHRDQTKNHVISRRCIVKRLI